MQLTIRATGKDVPVLSYLLAKNPSNLYERTINNHKIRIFYSKFAAEEVEVTFFVTPDSINLSRNDSEKYDITSYINDREFVVSSIFCTFLRSALGTALNGKPKEEYSTWVHHRFSFEFSFGPVASSLSDKEISALFQPLGYKLTITYGEVNYHIDLKAKSTARYITIKGLTTLQMGLRQLFVLIPVLDNYKHYFIDEKEIEKITRYGEGWLDSHPLREFIMKRALRFKEVYDFLEKKKSHQSVVLSTGLDGKIKLNDLRYEKILEKISQLKYKERIVDFGSGEGKLSVKLGFLKGIKEIIAVEPSEKATIQAIKRYENVMQSEKFLMPTQLFGSLFYYDDRLKDKDVMILCEVIEHIDANRLPKIMKMILKDYRPKTLIVTTPNQEYNSVYEMGERYRHPDHRFEWTREEFMDWCQIQNEDNNYKLTFEGIGEEHSLYGYPTQMCLFTRKEF